MSKDGTTPKDLGFTNIMDIVPVLPTRTVWIVSTGLGQYVAINHKGEIIARNKFKSTCEFIVKELARDAKQDILAIASVVAPQRRHRYGSRKHQR